MKDLPTISNNLKRFLLIELDWNSNATLDTVNKNISDKNLNDEQDELLSLIKSEFDNLVWNYGILSTVREFLTEEDILNFKKSPITIEEFIDSNIKYYNLSKKAVISSILKQLSNIILSYE